MFIYFKEILINHIFKQAISLLFAGVLISACVSGTSQNTDSITVENSGSGQVASLRAMWKVRDIMEACVQFVETGSVSEKLGQLGFKAIPKSGGILFSVKSNSSNRDSVTEITISMKNLSNNRRSCETVHNNVGGFGASGLVFAMHEKLRYRSNWTQVQPAPVGNTYYAGNGIWETEGLTLRKSVSQKRIGRERNGDALYKLKISLVASPK